ASARATHLEAATRKFLVTTNERKQMSTKTNFKRITLVAVAALGMSLISSVPSQAAYVGTPTVTVTNGTATTTTSDSTTAASIAVRYFADASTDTVSITVSLGIRPALAGAAGGTDSVMVSALDTSLSTGVTDLKRRAIGYGDTVFATANYGVDSATSAGTIGAAAAAGTSTGANAVIDGSDNTFAYGKFGYHLDSNLVRVAGTYTMNYVVRFHGISGTTGTDATKTVSGTFDIVVSTAGVAAAATVSASGTSTALMYGGTTFVAPTGGVDSSVSVPSTPDGTVRAVIRVTQLTAAGLPARESITVTTTIGNVGSSQAASGKSMTIVGNANGINDIQVFSDGNGGTAVITIKTTSVTFANKAVTFYGTTIATIAVTPLLTTIGNTSSGVLVATAKDATGTTVRTADGVYIYSDAATIVNTGTAPAGTSCGNYSSSAGGSGIGGYLCSVAGSSNGTANLTVRNASTTALSTVASAATAVKVNVASPATVVLSFDKATYAPGEVAYITVKPLDAAKAAIGATTFANLFATGGITSSIAFGNGSVTVDTLSAVSVTTAGKTAATDGIASLEAIAVYKVYMPASGGVVTIKAKGGASLPSSGQVDVTATATVTDNASAALAAVNALATTVASLKTLITTLTNLVLKIQKKVKA
ncbi:MAG: hypothetical protein GM48_2445, partial [actinobacterium acIB-AMD-7]